MTKIGLAAFAATFLYSTAVSACEVTKEQYLALKSGMSYSDAVSILGCPGEEMSSTDMAGYSTVMYMWEGSSMGANMNAMFQNDKMVSKAQFGLR